VILTLIDDSLFICVSSSSLTCEIPISLCCFLLYKKPSFFFFFFSTLFWMDGWVDGWDGRTFIPCRCSRFFFSFFILSFSYLLLLLPLLLYSRISVRKEAGEYFFHLLNLNFYHFFVLYSPKTSPPPFFFLPPSTWLYTDSYLSIYLYSYLLHPSICTGIFVLFFFFCRHWWLVLDSSGFRRCVCGI